MQGMWKTHKHRQSVLPALWQTMRDANLYGGVNNSCGATKETGKCTVANGVDRSRRRFYDHFVATVRKI
jgi:hypothetical protein